MVDKKEEHTAHSVASKITKALLKIKPEPKLPRRKAEGAQVNCIGGALFLVNP
jgi:hypothetical protein